MLHYYSSKEEETKLIKITEDRQSNTNFNRQPKLKTLNIQG